MSLAVTARVSSSACSTVSRAQIAYRSSPRGENDMQINRRLGGKNVYWQDGDGHLWEVLTVSYARPDSPALTTAGT